MEVEIATATMDSISGMGVTLTSGASMEVGAPLLDSSGSQALNNQVGTLTFFIPVCHPQGMDLETSPTPCHSSSKRCQTLLCHFELQLWCCWASPDL